MTGTAVQIINSLLKVANDPTLYDLTEHKDKRTRSQNAYYWVLLGQVARKLRITTTELHNRMLRDVSIPEVFGGKVARLLLPDTEETEQKALRSETVHLKPTAQTVVLGDGATYRTYALLKGSHDMNTDEMSALLDNLINEAKQIGVETMRPHELEELRRMEREKNAQKHNTEFGR